MSSRLVLRKDSSEVIMDSNYACVGFIKSGYLQYLGQWQRYQRVAANNPAMTPLPGAFDNIHGFTVKATAPLVFISGKANFQTSVRSGEFVTYYYAVASTSVRYYVYDLMSDRGPGTKLRLRDEAGNVTFDSEQLPLNIVATVTPPDPPGYSSTYLGLGAYAGGVKTSTGGGNFSTVSCTHSTYVGSGDYAATLPWNRGSSHTSPDSLRSSIGAAEGVYGNGNYCTFITSTDAGASINGYFQAPTGLGTPPLLFAMPVNRKPQASVIDVSDLPFPFDIT